MTKNVVSVLLQSAPSVKLHKGDHVELHTNDGHTAAGVVHSVETHGDMSKPHKSVSSRHSADDVTTRGEHHTMLVSQDGSSNVTMKVPQLRNLAEKSGFDLSSRASLLGFGFLHDGSVDSLERFVNESSFTLASDQDTADVVAFLLAFRGSDLPAGGENEPPGPPSADTHAAVGAQTTLDGRASAELDALLARFLAVTTSPRVGLVAHGRWKGEARGFVHVGGGRFQSDRADETRTLAELVAGAARGNELTLTLVPAECAQRLGVDRDGDGALDGDERDAGTRTDDAASRPRRTDPR